MIVQIDVMRLKVKDRTRKRSLNTVIHPKNIKYSIFLSFF